MHDKTTLAWQRYDAGRAYNHSLSPDQYSLVHTNVEFFAGNQWLHLPQSAAMSRLPKPTFNIIKRIASLFVASLTSSGVTIQFDPLSYYDGTNLRDPESNASAFATAEVQNILHKVKMNYRVREALFDGAQTGDYCAHFYWNPDALPYGGAFGPYRGEIEMEMVDGINVMFGNPNLRDAQKQPYILIVGRDTVSNLREEYRKYHGEDFGEPMIRADSEHTEQMGLGGKRELMAVDDEAGKCLYIYMYEKKTREVEVVDPENGETRTETVTSVYVTKATRSCTIYENIDTGLRLYPVAWGNWERQKNQYHGRALVTGIVPNQIFINSMFAMIMRHLQLQGFPKTVYNADMISQWNNEIGQAIAVHGIQPGQSVGQVAANLQPANMSDAIVQAIHLVMEYTKECLGATDVQMGNVKPNNTSALMVLQTSAEVPLENVRAGLYEWIEDIGAILLDMMGTYYGRRPIVRDRTFDEPVVDEVTGGIRIDPETGRMETKRVVRTVTETFDFDQFKHLFLNVRADVGAATYFSEIAMVQTLDNLRSNGTLEILDYLERIPDKLIPRKAELIEQVKNRMGIRADRWLPGSEPAVRVLPEEAQAVIDRNEAIASQS